MGDNTSELLIRYLDTVDTYLNTMRTSLGNLNRLMELHIEHSENLDERRHELERNNNGLMNRTSRRRRNIRNRFGRSVRSFNMSPMPSTSFNTSTDMNTSRNNSIAAPTFNFRRDNAEPVIYRSGITNPFAQTNAGFNNRIRNFINNTLNNSYTSSSASAESIANNTTEYIFEDISGETQQESCPISLTRFDPSSVILRIDHCGHIFKKSSLLEWFNVNTRCPICRYNIDPNNNTVNRSPINTTNSTQTPNTTNSTQTPNTTNSTQTPNTLDNSRVGVFDISFTIPNYLPLSSNDISNNEVNNLINNVSNVLTENINNLMTSENVGDISRNFYFRL